MALLCGIVALGGACSAESESAPSRADAGPGAGGSGAESGGSGGVPGSGALPGAGSSLSGFPETTGGATGRGGAEPGCSATGAAETALQPVRLAFVYDVSASMGRRDKPYHDPTLKWQPVVTATKAFFEDPGSAGISASMVFFPIDADEDERCDAASYAKPDVAFTALPSQAFGDAIDAITPESEDDWRSGTPTLAAVSSTLDFAKAAAKKEPGHRYAVVLVSDGYPQGCDDNDIESVADRVREVAGDMPTYVIGVSNPPDGPDTVSNLNQIAEAGGTGKAFVIETGDPEKTKTDFLSVVRAIRAGAVSCAFDVPEPPVGQSFDRTRANVSYAGAGASSDFAYDPECKGDAAWRYDDENAPTKMVLCDDTCARVRKDAGAVIRVEFGCTRREVIR